MNSEANLLLSDTQGTPGLAALTAFLFSTFDSMVAYFTLDLAMPLLGAFSNDDEEYVWSSIVIVSTAGRGLRLLSPPSLVTGSPTASPPQCLNQRQKKMRKFSGNVSLVSKEMHTFLIINNGLSFP